MEYDLSKKKKRVDYESKKITGHNQSINSKSNYK
jgi:hypothetical protein